MRTQIAVFATASMLLACPAENKPKAPPPAPAKAVSAPAAGAASNPAAAGSMPHEKIKKGPDGHPFKGLIKLGEGLGEADVKPTDVLFVMARESQGNGLAGRLIAVQRYSKLAFPKRYEIGPANVMVPGIPFTGPFVVTARLDRDGDPMTRGQDDLYANVPAPVAAGSESIHLVLKRGKKKEVTAPKGAVAPPATKAAKPIVPSSMPAKAASQPAKTPSQPK